jgi:hypothetical protein
MAQGGHGIGRHSMDALFFTSGTDGVSWHAVPAQIGGIESSGIQESIFSSQCKVQSTIV